MSGDLAFGLHAVGEVLRSRPEVVRIRFRYSDLTGGDAAALGFRFRDGDAVVVE
jgi:hypothetical protein